MLSRISLWVAQFANCEGFKTLAFQKSRVNNRKGILVTKCELKTRRVFKYWNYIIQRRFSCWSVPSLLSWMDWWKLQQGGNLEDLGTCYTCCFDLPNEQDLVQEKTHTCSTCATYYDNIIFNSNTPNFCQVLFIIWSTTVCLEVGYLTINFNPSSICIPTIAATWNRCRFHGSCGSEK